jgi:7-cyano-7-deazaguanine synthase in queuosine biosynthesis
MRTHDFFCVLDECFNGYPDKSSRVIDLLNPNNFEFSIKGLLKKFPGMIAPEALDLLYLSLFVFSVDRLALRNEAEDNWSRKLHISVPVLSLEKWTKEKKLVETILKYLSGDYWDVDFYERDMLPYENKAKSYFSDLLALEKQAKTICMLSGGLDSFVGAIDLLEKSNDVLFVSHYGGGKGTKEYQDTLIESFIKKYKINRESFFQFHAATISGKENTQRTRSLIFFSHAIAIASGIKSHTELIVPENGLISLNIPLTHSRLGSSSTRTTHPYYMGLLQKLINNLGLHIKMQNPYQFCTKGEMLLNCRNMDFLKNNLEKTMSCSHPDSGRVLGETTTRHCGYCLPCIIRRAAIMRAGFNDPSNYRYLSLKQNRTARLNLNSYNISLKKFVPNHAFLKIQNSGPITNDILRYADLYCRGMNELKELLEAINDL